MPPKGSGRNPDAPTRPRGIELRAECAVAPAIRVEATASAIQPEEPKDEPTVWLRTPAGAPVRVVGGKAGLPKFCARHGLQEDAIARLLTSDGGEHRGWRTGSLSDEGTAGRVVLHVRWEDSSASEPTSGQMSASEAVLKRSFRSVGVPPGSTGEEVQDAVRRKLGVDAAVPIAATERLVATTGAAEGELGSRLPWDELAGRLVASRPIRLEISEVSS